MISNFFYTYSEQISKKVAVLLLTAIARRNGVKGKTGSGG